MAYETGIAQNERDLLDKLNKFLTTNEELVQNGQAWTVIYDKILPSEQSRAECRQIMWKSTGTGIEQDVYIGCESVNDISLDIYNLNFFGGTFFNKDLINKELLDIKTGVINISPSVVLFADARPVEYTIVANGRCFKVIVQISNVCSSAYLGFILPTVSPTEYPYPLCVAGSAPVTKGKIYSYSPIFLRYSTTDSYNSSILNPCEGNCWLFTPDQSWRDFCGRSSSSYSNDTDNQRLYPLVYVSDGMEYVLKTLTASPGDAYPLIPVEFMSFNNSTQGINRWGCYDGIYWIPGVQRATGDKVDLPDGTKGVVCNNSYKTSTLDYFVLELGR